MTKAVIREVEARVAKAEKDALEAAVKVPWSNIVVDQKLRERVKDFKKPLYNVENDNVMRNIVCRRRGVSK